MSNLNFLVYYVLCIGPKAENSGCVLQISSVQVSDSIGRARIDTKTPRGEDEAYWITYTGMDSAGNIGTGLRQVLISCPENEQVCWENDDSRPSACSLNGRCVDQSLSAALGSTSVDGMCSQV